MNTTASRWNRSALGLLGAGLIVALTGGVVLTAQAQPMMDGGPRMGMMGGHHGGPKMGGMPMMHGRMLDAVNATAEQRSQIRSIMDNAQADMLKQREAGRSLHEQMRQAFTQPTVDARAVEALRQQMLAQHDSNSKRMMQAMLDVSRVLTPEQRAKLAELQAQRAANMERRTPPR
mgnify:CR=1 FL=1